MLSTGGQWAALPEDLPPRTTVNDGLRRRAADRTRDRSTTRWIRGVGGRARSAAQARVSQPC